MFDSQIQQEVKRQPPLFYFKYPMKLEFIPFIEQEVQEFIAFASRIMQETQKIDQILIIVNKKIADIDQFYRDHWSDYRIQQILKSKNYLKNFCREHHHKISDRIVKEKDKSQVNKQVLNKGEKQLSKKGEMKQKEEKLFVGFNDMKHNSIDKIQLTKNTSLSIKKGIETHVGSPLNKKIDFQEKKNSKSKSKFITESPKFMNLIKQSPKTGSILKESPKTGPKIIKKEPQRKQTKQQYIEYLRNKKQIS